MPGTVALVLKLAPSARVRGRVLDENGMPIGEGVRVWATRSFDSPSPLSVEDREPGTSIGSDGTFELDGFLDGEWRLIASRMGYAQSTAIVTVPQTGRPVEIVMLRTGTISGVVVDREGRPIPQADLLAWRSTLSTNSPRTLPRRTRSDSEGRFTLMYVDPGSLYVLAFAEGREDGPSIPIELRSGQSVEDLRVQVGPAKETRNR